VSALLSKGKLHIAVMCAHGRMECSEKCLNSRISYEDETILAVRLEELRHPSYEPYVMFETTNDFVDLLEALGHVLPDVIRYEFFFPPVVNHNLKDQPRCEISRRCILFKKDFHDITLRICLFAIPHGRLSGYQ